MEHAGIHWEPATSAFWQKAQISCISSQTVSLGLEIPLIWSFLYSQVPGGFSTGLWLLHHWQTTRYVLSVLNRTGHRSFLTGQDPDTQIWWTGPTGHD